MSKAFRTPIQIALDPSTSSYGTLSIGTSPLPWSETDLMTTFIDNVNSYTQLVIQNKNAGAIASSDIIFYNDTTPSGGGSGYGDLGKNSSGWTGTSPWNDPNGLYLYNDGGTLSIGTNTAHDLKFATGASNVMILRSSGSIDFVYPTGGTLASIGPSARFTLPAATTSQAGLNIPQGTAPTSPINGDIWTTSTGFFIRYNGTTVNVTSTTGATLGADNTFTGANVFTSSTTIRNILLNAGTSTIAPLDFASGTYLTAPNGGELEYDGNALSFTSNSTASGGRGVVATQIFTSVASATPLGNLNTAQKIFSNAASSIYLARDTTYEMEMNLLVFTSGITSHSTGLGFNAGTISYIPNGFSYTAIVSQTTTASAATSASTTTAANMVWITSSANNTILAAAASAHFKRIFVKGMVRTNTTGTFIPTLTFSAQPGATGSVLPNSYIKLTPLGTSSVVATSGWF